MARLLGRIRAAKAAIRRRGVSGLGEQAGRVGVKAIALANDLPGDGCLATYFFLRAVYAPTGRQKRRDAISFALAIAYHLPY